ncbi:ABC transporter substrate-binding protein [Microbacterium invictum]|uniref:Raffinose/stachyose/melibiose transport system substrate-binding protein n=1 Tax=Microbacterium invictum TaxID=515415 RepID=A0AA40SPZ2_9MICO|nr:MULTISPECIES: ABC transporter substrate-binding protein [Microbacterium]MBB4140275.1 raffinose/stachyose/melibiose transport system substrate-binding protein [Microbacterium invictum]
MIQRRILAASVLVAAAGLTLTACSTTPAGESDAEPGGSITIAWQSTEAPSLKPVIEAFKEENPGVEVTLVEASIEQYFASLPTQLSSGSAPDVFLVWAGWGNAVAQKQLAQYGYLEDLSGEDFVSEIPEGIAGATQTDDKTYMMPTTMLGFSQWYNMDALEEAGLTPPSTVDELFQFCADATAADKIPYAQGSATASSNSRGFNGFYADLMDGRTIAEVMEPISDGTSTYAESDVWVEGMEQYQRMIEAGCFPSDAVAIDQAAEDDLFVSGEALGSMAPTNQKTAWVAKAPDGNFELHPATENILLYNNKGAAVNAASKNKELAIAFVNFFSQPEQRAAFAAGLAGVLPAIPVDEPIEDPNLQLLADKQAAGETVGFYAQFWEDPKLDSVEMSSIQAMYLGQNTAADVIAALDAEQAAFLADK